MTAEPARESQELYAVPDYEEPEDAALRSELSLRRIAYRSDGDAGAPVAPCPTWCWVPQNEGYEHDVEHARPFSPSHSMEPIPSVAASLYPGWTSSEEGGDTLSCTATIEVYMRAEGSAEPVIGVGLRQASASDHRSFQYDSERLRMSREDARDLIKVLTYVLEASEERT